MENAVLRISRLAQYELVSDKAALKYPLEVLSTFKDAYFGKDVYKRQALEWPALDFARLRPEQTILGLILEDDDDELLTFDDIADSLSAYFPFDIDFTWSVGYNCFAW